MIVLHEDDPWEHDPPAGHLRRLPRRRSPSLPSRLRPRRTGLGGGSSHDGGAVILAALAALVALILIIALDL